MKFGQKLSKFLPISQNRWFFSEEEEESDPFASSLSPTPLPHPSLRGFSRSNPVATLQDGLLRLSSQ